MSPPRRPRPKISLWARFLRFVRYWKSPLTLRDSITRLRRHHTHPVLALIRLFIPFPTWSFPLPGPFSPCELIEDKQNGGKITNSQFGTLRTYQNITIWRMRDTPLRSIYRIYELHLIDIYTLLGYETEYFFFQKRWHLRDIPDPNDPDLIRCAMLASIVEELHESVNWKLSLGLRRNGEILMRENDGDPYPPYIPEELPAWTKNVPAIDKELLKQSIPMDKLNEEGQLVLEEKGINPTFTKRNIVTNTGWFYTI